MQPLPGARVLGGNSSTHAASSKGRELQLPLSTETRCRLRLLRELCSGECGPRVVPEPCILFFPLPAVALRAGQADQPSEVRRALPTCETKGLPTHVRGGSPVQPLGVCVAAALTQRGWPPAPPFFSSPAELGYLSQMSIVSLCFLLY